MTRRIRRRAAAVVALWGVVAAACGGGGASPTQPSSSVTPASKPPSLEGTWKGTWTARDVGYAVSEPATATIVQPQSDATVSVMATLSGSSASFSFPASSGRSIVTAKLSQGGKCEVSTTTALMTMSDGVLTLEVTVGAQYGTCNWPPTQTIRLTR